jgi:G3E family GTPase
MLVVINRLQSYRADVIVLTKCHETSLQRYETSRSELTKLIEQRNIIILNKGQPNSTNQCFDGEKRNHLDDSQWKKKHKHNHVSKGEEEKDIMPEDVRSTKRQHSQTAMSGTVDADSNNQCFDDENRSHLEDSQ